MVFKLYKLKIEITIIKMTVDIPAILSKLNNGLSFIYVQYNITGRINPIIGLTVLPTIDIDMPMSGTSIAINTQKLVSIRVTIAFWLNVILFSLKNSSSIESLQGIMQIGNPAMQEISKANLAIYIKPISLYPGACSIFLLHNYPKSDANVA